MTYGWAILVVLVAIGALAYFGVLSPDQMLPEKCVISSGSGLFCDKFTVGSDVISLKVKNSLSKKVNITNIEVTDATLCNFAAVQLNVTIPANEDATASVSGCSLTDKISSDIKISYTVDNFPKTTTGTIVAKVS